MQMVSMEWSLGQLYRLGFRPSTIVDVGAFQGDWARIASNAFPEASVLMIEAQENMTGALEAAASQIGNGSEVHIGLVGAESGKEVEFFELETGSTVLAEHSSAPRTMSRRTIETLDDIASRRLAKPVDLLKLDVQGYELEVLKGARNVIASAEVVVSEVSFLPINEGAPLAAEVFEFMKHHGFVAYDISGLVRRPLDLALWQADFVFVKAQSWLRASFSYD
jgi:FkbM family methyltransferase